MQDGRRKASAVNALERTPEERMAALDKAMEARRKRQAVKEQLRNGSATLVELLDSDDEAVRKMRIVDALMSIPYIGKGKTERIMEEACISEKKRVGGLGKRQREYLLERFG
ncbi:hypothetical protein GMI70_01965 [Eggerthellaceae bacterium zg-893]|nr:hypothetical protein [Eggerthellaceae bacterium zg-893]